MGERRKWFSFNGSRGDRTLEMQRMGLGMLEEAVEGMSVLDLGCAEGVLIDQYLRWGATHVHGVEIVPEAVEDARHVLEGWIESGSAHVFHGSVANLDAVSGLHDRYDIVTALAVLHKVERPDLAALAAARRANTLLVIRNPPEHKHVIATERQRGWRYDLRATLASSHFLGHVDYGWNGEWVGYFFNNSMRGKVEEWTEH